jgi:hypothetical protein
MKTAIQQAIIMVKNRIETIDETLMGKHSIHHLQQVERDLYDLLKKEKEQMLDFGLYVKKNGWVGCKIEDLYEDYNNQNK